MKYLAWLALLLSTLARGQDIVVWKQLLEHPNPAVAQLLRLALDNTRAEYGDYRLVSSGPMEQGRAVYELAKGERVQVGVFAPDPKRIGDLLPVPVPLAKGLLGWRVCLIGKGDQSRFKGVTTLAQWRAKGLKVGQHLHWPDTAILQANGVEVVTNPRYDSLFRMLKAGRFHCLPRSVLEVQDEARHHPALTIEPSLVLRYPLPLLYFVAPQYPQLAKRLTLGLQRARQSGDFERIFQRHFQQSAAMLDGRVVIELDNPGLTQVEGDMLADPSLWYGH